MLAERRVLAEPRVYQISVKLYILPDANQHYSNHSSLYGNETIKLW